MFLQQKDDELKEHQVDEPNVEKFKKALNWIDVRVAEVIKGFTEKSPGDEGYDEDTQNDSPVAYASVTSISPLGWASAMMGAIFHYMVK